MSATVRHLPTLAKHTHQLLMRRLRRPRYRPYQDAIENALADLMVDDDLMLGHGVDSIGRLWTQIKQVPFMDEFLVQAGVELHVLVSFKAGEWQALVDRFANALANDGEPDGLVDGDLLNRTPTYMDIAPTLRNSSWLMVLLVLANSSYEEQFLGV